MSYLNKGKKILPISMYVEYYTELISKNNLCSSKYEYPLQTKFASYLLCHYT
jgi:hypothetical protein